MAKKPAKKKGKDKKGGGAGMVVGLFCALLMLFFMSYAGLLIVVGMMPTFVAFYVDRSRYRENAKVVATCNLTGLMPFIIQGFERGVRSTSVQNMIFDSYTWLSILGFSAFGWMLVWLFPRVSIAIISYVQNSHAAILQKQQQAIIDEWGTEIEAEVQRLNLRKAALMSDPKRKEMFMKAKSQ